MGEFPDQPLAEIKNEFIELGVWDSSNSNMEDFENQINQYSRAYSQFGRDFKPVFPEIYTTLEDLRKFAEN